MKAIKKETGWTNPARFLFGVPTGSRTPVASVKGRCPRPLDDGDLEFPKIVFYYNPAFRGGGKRDRTADLLHAMQALSQLSYTPEKRRNIKDGREVCPRLLHKTNETSFRAGGRSAASRGYSIAPRTASGRPGARAASPACDARPRHW